MARNRESQTFSRSRAQWRQSTFTRRLPGPSRRGPAARGRIRSIPSNPQMTCKSLGDVAAQPCDPGSALESFDVLHSPLDFELCRLDSIKHWPESYQFVVWQIYFRSFHG